MAKPRALSSPTAGISCTPPQHMYLLEGGLLVVSNLLKTDAWVRDTDRSHCTVCVQQFLPFRRRHHCRTCGEVVCASCSAQRKIHLTDVNVECATRVCSFCMIRATDAAIHAAETVLRESVALDHLRHAKRQHATDARPVATLPRGRPHPPPASRQPLPRPLPLALPPPPPPARVSRVSKPMSMLSLESELTDGSVVQLWPPVAPADEPARLAVARNETIRASERDPTMALLVSIVARTLECPVAFIGILDQQHLWFKAAVGWDRANIPRDDCVCAAQQKTMIVADTNQDKHFHANTLTIHGAPMRYYAGAPIRVLGQCIGAVSAIDSSPHWETSAAMKSTLEAVANIVSEVLEQRVDGTSTAEPALDPLASLAATLPVVRHTTQPAFAPSDERALSSASTVSIASPVKATSVLPPASSCGSESTTLVDIGDTMRDLRAIQYSPESSMDSDEEDEFLSDDGDGDEDADSGRASETAVPAAPSAVHPWPPMRSSMLTDRMSSTTGDDAFGVAGMPRFSLAVPGGPPDVVENVGKAMEFFQALQSSRWSPCSSFVTNANQRDEILSFELLTQGRHFTKSHAKLAGDCTHVIARLQTYDDARLYSDLVEYVTQRRQKINVQTWVDHVQLHPGFEASHYPDVRVLSHWRQYPDGSNVIVAFNDSNQELLMVEDFLFGWFIAPSAPDKHGNCFVNVSSIVAEPVAAAIHENQNQYDPFNLSKRLVQRLQHSLPYHYDVAPLVSVGSDQSLSTSSSVSSADNQHSHDSSFIAVSYAPAEGSTSTALTGVRPRCASSSSPGDAMLSIRSKYSGVSSLNDNERMMLDLLDKTISTQEVLAAQQHVMANVMDYHGTQLQRISSAIDRVENILHTNGDKLKQLGVFSKSSPKQGDRRESRDGRHSISL